jgi:hypothetical protein
MEPLPRDGAPPAEAPPTLLAALARVPAAAALVAALGSEDRKALRLVHTQLRDAVGEATTKLEVTAQGGAAAARPPAPRCWPRLEELTVTRPDPAALDALGAETWGRLRNLSLGDESGSSQSALGAPAARALAAALRRMPALRVLELEYTPLSDEAAKLFRASSEEAAPRLRELKITAYEEGLTPAAVRALAASG